jgi:hypothetical protein
MIMVSAAWCLGGTPCSSWSSGYKISPCTGQRCPGGHALGDELDYVLAVTDDQLSADIDGYPGSQAPPVLLQLQQDVSRGLRRVRAAGLITTTRHGHSVHHALAPTATSS